VQRDVFASQIEWARRHGLPLVVHSRSAWDDTFAVLDEAGAPDRTVFHCFTGGPDEARRALDRGAHLSFSGIVTFPKALEVREAAAICPDDRLLVETDAPYLAPVPHRGRRNRPAWVVHVGERLAEVRGVPATRIAEITTANGRHVYGI
jgi:TatD DNase family protein